jgi:hypothetical protein
MLLTLIGNAMRFLWLCLRSPATLTAENLFLHRQLAFYLAHTITLLRTTNVTWCILVRLSSWFDWPQALTVVHLEMFTRWQR